jgi:signal transduction histidine kinase
LFNVAKHAKVDHATVNLVKTKDNVIQVEVADQGVGFSESITDGKGPSSGIGLFHLRERLLAIGGFFETCSCAGQGSKVLVSVPLDVELSSENPGKGKGTRDEQ